MKYKYSNCEVGEVINGKDVTTVFCDRCNKGYHNNFGFIISYARHGSRLDTNIALCGKCASLIIPKLEAFTKELLKECEPIAENRDRKAFMQAVTEHPEWF